MKRIGVVLGCFSMFISSMVSSQSQGERCGFNAAIEYNELLKPGYKEHVSQVYTDLLGRITPYSAHRSSEEVYTIPVVIHVVWNTNHPEQNLHDSIITGQIDVLNEDFSRTNEDTVNLRAAFQDYVGNANIQFKLACVDPNGNSTNGIIRVETSETFGGGFLPDMAEIARIQSSSSGGSDSWDPTKYFNIWVGDINGGASPSVLGVATPPPNLSNWPINSVPAELEDGAIIQYQTFGPNNPNTLDLGGGPIVVTGRTATHEVGHYLGVRHTAENTFGGLVGSICGDDDGLEDTPNCDQSEQNCDINRNSCTDHIGPLGIDLPDMIENYMDYSSEECQNSFTKGQTAIMRSVLENERSTLLSSNGLSACQTSVGLPSSMQTGSFDVYPNPSNGLITVNWESSSQTIVEIVNSLGQVIHSMTLQGSGKQEITIEKNGVYFIRNISGNLLTTKKLIIN